MTDTLWHRDADRWLMENRREFERLVDHAQRLLGRKRFEEAALMAEAAAQFAWLNHPGLHVSPALEALCRDLGQTLVPTEPQVRQSRSILHVVTATFTIGGHTRTIWRWAHLDPAHRHSVAMTAPTTGRPVTGAVVEAVQRNGGAIFELAKPGNHILEKAKTLRALATQYELVVLHVHPSDVTPAIAFADPTGLPPIVYWNHADHVFWLGAECANLVVNIRRRGQLISERRRGLSDDHLAIMPLPLDPEVRARSRCEAKRMLGIPANGRLLLTVATAYKFAPISSVLNFVSRQSAFLERHADLTHVIVGMDPESLASSASPRLRAVAATPDLAIYYDAADLYVDSYPFGSLTSLLEAGQRGTPIASLQFGSDLADVLRGADDSTDDILETARPKDWEGLLTQLVESQAADVGRVAQIINSHHLNPAWQSEIEAVYQKAHCVGRISLRSVAAGPNDLDRFLVSIHACSAFAKPLAMILSGYVRRANLSFLSELFVTYPRLLPTVIFRLAGQVWRRLCGRSRI